MNKKFALCIGNNYPGTPAELNGCVNDANDWTTLLKNEGYDVVTIHEATKAQMVLALQEALKKTGFGDRLVFTYSGHGTWVPDTGGDEPDKRDEALVPADYQQGYVLTDDELDQIFSARRYGAGVLMLSDSCHSGTVTRFFDMRGSVRPKFLPPSNVRRDVDPDDDFLVGARGSLPAPSQISLISGCADDEFSYDAWFDDRANGAFTYYAIQTYQKGMTLGQWFAAIRWALPDEEFYPQSPQLTATYYREKVVRAL